MDSLESATLDIQSLFYQGAYDACINAVRQNSSAPLSDYNQQQRLMYGARSAIALNNPSAALALLPEHSINTPAAQAVRGLARYVTAQATGNAAGTDAALTELQDTLDQAVLGDPTGQTIRVCVATAMARDGDHAGALEVLGVGRANSKEIECIALGVHILLAISRPDAAQKEYNAARQWADDSLLIQLIEAHIGIYEGGRAAQQAYYVYDELAQNPAMAGQASIVTSLTGKAVARIVSSEYAEASSALAEASQLDARHADALANKVPLALLNQQTGQSEAVRTAVESLRAVAPQHPLLQDMADKERLFDEALAKHQEALSAA